MNEENLNDNLKDLEKTLLYTGMKNISHEQLKSKMVEGQPNFTVNNEEKFGEAKAMAIVDVGLSKKNNYFPNQYEMNVELDGNVQSRTYKFRRPELVIVKDETGEEKKQRVNSTITFKEAFNQMQGRAINKDFVAVDKNDPSKNRKYNAWELIDFDKTDDKGVNPVSKIYNFKMEEKLREYPLQELLQPDTEKRLMESLKRGNLQLVTYIKEDKSLEKLFFSADPINGDFKKYNAKMEPILLSLKRDSSKLEKTEEVVQHNVPSQKIANDPLSKNKEMKAGEKNKPVRKGRKVRM